MVHIHFEGILYIWYTLLFGVPFVFELDFVFDSTLCI